MRKLLHTALGLIGIMGTLSMGEVMANDYIVPDTENGTITVYSQDYSYGITIQDKNLGAENVRDYGYYYQWGNNHGNYAGTNTGTPNELLDADVSERVNKGYSGGNDNFIIFDNGNKYTYDYRSGVYYTNVTDNSYVGDSAYNNLRGGGNDNDDSDATIVKGYDTVNHVVTNPDNRQGPCPEGYHVPSAGEWHELMMLRCNANSDICSGSIIKSQDRDEEYEWAYYLDDGGEGIIGTAFMNDLLLPFAGHRGYYDGAVYGQGDYACYRLSSPREGSSPETAWYLYFNPSFVDPSSYDNRADGYSLRCFKNSYAKLPKTLNLFFMSDDEEVGTGTITENITGSIPASAESVSRTGYELLYWSLSGADAEFDFATTPISGDWADESGNVYFIAQWTPVEYTISYELDGGTNSENNTGKYTIETPDITLENPTKDGFNFEGWFSDAEFTTGVTTIPRGSTGDITLYAKWVKIENKTSGGYSGGGGGSSLKKDNCPNGDYSDSYYDGTCGQKPTQKDENKDNDSNENIDNSESDPNYSQEMNDAYKFAYFYGITTMPTIKEADMDGYIIRSHLAKMMSQFAINVMGAKPNIGKEGCDKFNDIAAETDELKGYMKTACELGLMGLHADGKTVKDNFDPNDYVTRAEFGTVLSRFLYLDENNLTTQEIQEGAEWYSKHLSALKLNGIMTQIDGQRITSKELRGYVMLMLMRSAQK